MARGSWEKAKNEESTSASVPTEKRKSSGRELKASSGPKVAESLLPHPLQSSAFLSQGCHPRQSVEGPAEAEAAGNQRQANS